MRCAEVSVVSGAVRIQPRSQRSLPAHRRGSRAAGSSARGCAAVKRVSHPYGKGSNRTMYPEGICRKILLTTERPVTSIGAVSSAISLTTQN